MRCERSTDAVGEALVRRGRESRAGGKGDIAKYNRKRGDTVKFGQIVRQRRSDVLTVLAF